jgi:hypothetical protein
LVGSVVVVLEPPVAEQQLGFEDLDLTALLLGAADFL